MMSPVEDVTKVVVGYGVASRVQIVLLLIFGLTRHPRARNHGLHQRLDRAELPAAASLRGDASFKAAAG
jgi:hypothetical protein